jgi:pimeloyl-ACP methyl ester carboxylesterase
MGHEVFTPTQTGVGERAHQANENIPSKPTFATSWAASRPRKSATLSSVGHSYGGMAITGVADRMADRIKALVYLDAFVPGDGESLMALLHKTLEPPAVAQFIGDFRGGALEKNSGMMHPIPAEMFNVSAAKS